MKDASKQISIQIGLARQHTCKIREKKQQKEKKSRASVLKREVYNRAIREISLNEDELLLLLRRFETHEPI